MKDLVEKIEDFLFDFLGLIVPGFILIMLIITPLLLIELNSPPIIKAAESSSILSILYNAARYVDYFFKQPTDILFIILTVSSYIIGHLIKVLSIIKYEFLSAIFDKFIIKILADIQELFINSRINKWLVKKLEELKWLRYIFSKFKDLFKPIRQLLIKIFTFNPPNYFRDNDSLKIECIQMINKKMNTNYPNEWYSIYKISGIINTHENIKSLAYNFLAKYNFYRSMSLIFLFMFIYYWIFFQNTIKFLSPSIICLKLTILIGISLLWFVFHYKFKRYWTLCGNETLVSLFYFLKKTENGK